MNVITQMRVATVVGVASGGIMILWGCFSNSIPLAIGGGAILLGGIITGCAAEIKESLEK